MSFTITQTKLNDVYIIEQEVFSEDRGFFFESFNEKDFQKTIGKDFQFVQDNFSSSKKNVIRGLHYQIKNPQGKLVRVLNGEVFDVTVDLRVNSRTFGEWYGIKLSAENNKQLWIPEGFAHGFLV